jgi:hypothetical protein
MRGAGISPVIVALRRAVGTVRRHALAEGPARDAAHKVLNDSERPGVQSPTVQTGLSVKNAGTRQWPPPATLHRSI